jgi:hypothetical protein
MLGLASAARDSTRLRSVIQNAFSGRSQYAST